MTKENKDGIYFGEDTGGDTMFFYPALYANGNWTNYHISCPVLHDNGYWQLHLPNNVTEVLGASSLPCRQAKKLAQSRIKELLNTSEPLPQATPELHYRFGEDTGGDKRYFFSILDRKGYATGYHASSISVGNNKRWYLHPPHDAGSAVGETGMGVGEAEPIICQMVHDLLKPKPVYSLDYLPTLVHAVHLDHEKTGITLESKGNTHRLIGWEVAPDFQLSSSNLERAKKEALDRLTKELSDD